MAAYDIYAKLRELGKRKRNSFCMMARRMQMATFGNLHESIKTFIMKSWWFFIIVPGWIVMGAHRINIEAWQTGHKTKPNFGSVP